MKKIIFISSLAIALSLSIYGVAMAAQNRVVASPGHSGNAVTIPESAVEVSPGLFYLGEATDVDGQVVQGYAFVKKAPAKGANNSHPTKPPKTDVSTCYGFMANGAKWKTIESWEMNPSNEFGIDEALAYNLEAKDIAKWEDAAGKQIIGSGMQTSESLVADESSPDGLNEVYFGELDPGTIGVTIVWGVFGGPPKARELREWDQVFNTYYDWSAESYGVPNMMDFENISTHELGHTMGMDDLYTSDCSEETMYGYGDFAETYKRDLAPGDTAGIQALYK